MKDEKLVYVLLANRNLKYEYGRSRIAYIGTTKKGVSRIASSVAGRADNILGQWGVTKITVRVVTCRARQKVRMWRKLERAMLLEFRCKYGVVPKCNTQGKGIKEGDEFNYFSRDRIRAIMERLG